MEENIFIMATSCAVPGIGDKFLVVKKNEGVLELKCLHCEKTKERFMYSLT